MAKRPSTTVRIRLEDKEKLDELCRDTKRGIVDMIALLVQDAHAAHRKAPRRTRRKAG